LQVKSTCIASSHEKKPFLTKPDLYFSIQPGCTEYRDEFFRSAAASKRHAGNKPAKAGDYFHITQFVEGYQSIRNKNALKSILTGSNISNIDYPSDADGKITSLILTGSSSATLIYQYQCN
jgi:hypothetical protein